MRARFVENKMLPKGRQLINTHDLDVDIRFEHIICHLKVVKRRNNVFKRLLHELQ